VVKGKVASAEWKYQSVLEKARVAYAQHIAAALRSKLRGRLNSCFINSRQCCYIQFIWHTLKR